MKHIKGRPGWKSHMPKTYPTEPVSLPAILSIGIVAATLYFLGYGSPF